MRFEATRALGWSGRLAAAGRPGSAGDCGASEVVAEELARLGLRVERVEVRETTAHAWARAAPGWLGVGLWGAALGLAIGRGAAWPGVAAGVVVAAAWAWLMVVEGEWPGGARPRRSSATSLIAGRAEGQGPGVAPPVRVVFQTPLDASDLARTLTSPRPGHPALGAMLAATALAAALTVPRGRAGPFSWPIAAVLGLLVLGLARRVARRLRDRAGAVARDNRNGLAVLLELARSWPRPTDARIEVRFAATGGGGGEAGLRALVRAIEEEWPTRPTLVVGWLAPGVGPGLLLAERGTGGLATSAAADLWIPHRIARRVLRPFGRRGPASVAIVGDAFGRPGPARPADPEALARAAQLATEVALRWARRRRTPVDDEPGT